MSLPNGVLALDVPQGSAEWLAAKCGVLSGSRALAVVTQGKGSAPSAMRETLKMQLVLEYITRKYQGGFIVTDPMQAGTDREPLAFARHEAETGECLTRSGWLYRTDARVGCSLDAYIGDYDSLVSIKCRQPKAHYEAIKGGAIDKGARVQMIHELWITGAQSHSYVSFNPDFPKGLQYHCVTVPRDEAEIAAYATEATKFLAEVQTEIDTMQTLGGQR